MTSPQRSPPLSPLDLRESRDLKFCLMCRDRPNHTEYICGDCALPLCAECRKAHEGMPRYATHRILPFIEVSRCSQHGKRRLLFCLDCSIECCLICAHFGLHRDHRVQDKAAAMLAQQLALTNENESLKKKIEARLLGRIEAIQSFMLEVTSMEEEAVKTFQLHVADRRRILTNMCRSWKEKADGVKAPCEGGTIEKLKDFREQLTQLESTPSPESPHDLLHFSFSRPFETALPTCPPSPHSALPDQHHFQLSVTESPRARTALVQGIEFEEMISLPDEERGEGYNAEDLHCPVESEVRNPTIPPKSRECIYVPVNDSPYLLSFDLESRHYRHSPTRRSWPRFCSLTLLHPDLALITGGGEQPSSSVFLLNLQSFVSTERTGLMIARNYHSSILTSSGALVVGGFNQVMQRHCEMYSEDKNEWRNAASLNIARGALGICSHQGGIYAFGGWDGHQEVAEIECLKGAEVRWEILGIELPQPSQCNAVSMETFILIFAYQAECAYSFTPERIYKFSPIPNEAWGRPELTRYKDSVFCFKSDSRKVMCFDTRRKEFRVVAIEQ